MKNKQVIVALDGMKREQALLTAWTLASSVWGFKVNDLLITHGIDIIRDLKCIGRVFADPKLYDTPTTVANSISRLSESGADFITVHASGGKEMMQAALENAGDSKILAVSILTSMDNAQVQETYFKSVDETVWDLSHCAYEVGVHGIVCASQDINMLKHMNILKVVPGIRSEQIDDQKRIGNGEGADYIVVGRAITRSPDPLKALFELTGDSND